MHIGPHIGSTQFTVDAYAEDSITINQIKYSDSILLLKEQLVSPWTQKAIGELGADDFNEIIDAKPQVLIVGTGKSHIFFDASITMLFHQQHIGLETMTTSAACRTYNVLASEGRNVAGLFFIA